MKYVAVTGCRGFLGHHLVRHLTQRGDYVLGIDSETYAGIHPLHPDLNFQYVKADIAELKHLPDVDAIINCAAETHVDNSLASSRPFLHANVLGVWNLLELVRAKQAFRMPTFVQVSTDEVLGSIPEGAASPDRPLAPANPYAASKAAAEVLVQGWGRTHTMPWQIVRMTNLYGTGQYPEKLIPKTVRSFRLGRNMPIHGDGSAVRHWLSVRDACTGLLTILDRAPEGHIYHLGGNTEASVRDVTLAISHLMADGPTPVQFGFNRQSLDARYCLDDSLTRALGWTAAGDFWNDLSELVRVERQAWRW